MLDRLEEGILSLLPNPGKAEPAKRPKRPKRPTAKPKKRRPVQAKRGSEEIATEPAETVATVGEGPEQKTEAERILGKRQALGRSLLQLRKLSVSRNQNETPH